jgi:hypothetical protein
MCEACGRRTAVSYAHGNLCEWCDARRGRCLDCEVSRAFDSLGALRKGDHRAFHPNR